MLSFYEVFNSLSLCFVYLVLFYKPFQTFIIVLLVQYRYTVTIQHPVRLIVDWFFRCCIFIYIYIRIIYSFDKLYIKYKIQKTIVTVSIIKFLWRMLGPFSNTLSHLFYLSYFVPAICLFFPLVHVCNTIDKIYTRI